MLAGAGAQQGLGAADGGLVQQLVAGRAIGEQRRGVECHVASGACRVEIRVGDVRHDPLHRQIIQLVAPAARPDQAAHVMAVAHQCAHDVRADQSRGASDNCPHAARRGRGMARPSSAMKIVSSRRPIASEVGISSGARDEAIGIGEVLGLSRCPLLEALQQRQRRFADALQQRHKLLRGSSAVSSPVGHADVAAFDQSLEIGDRRFEEGLVGMRHQHRPQAGHRAGSNTWKNGGRANCCAAREVT